MRRTLLVTIALNLALLSWLSACESQKVRKTAEHGGFHPEYLAVDTQLLDDDLVNFHVLMKGARTKADVADYAECAAAQYTLIRGYGFTRHVRTNVEEDGGVWRADAVYTVSASLPEGKRTLDAEVVLENCRDHGIPTV